jgi:hypothetical protein
MTYTNVNVEKIRSHKQKDSESIYMDETPKRKHKKMRNKEKLSHRELWRTLENA